MNGSAFMGDAVLPSQRLHADLHHGTRLYGETQPEFDKRHVKIIRLSVDKVDDHARWAADIKETQGYAPNNTAKQRAYGGLGA